MAQSCCNPFDIPGHAWKSHRRNLRPVIASMCERAPQISIGSEICDTCRKELSKESHVSEPLFSELVPPSPPSPPSSRSPEAKEHEPLHYQTSVAVSSLNKCLAELGETPYSQESPCKELS